MNRILYLFSSAIERDAAMSAPVRNELLVDICGVGLVDAGIGATRSIIQHAPDAVVYLGTCGAYRSSGYSIGELVIGESTCIGSGDVSAHAMRIPTLLESDVRCDESLARMLLSRSSIDPSRNIAADQITTHDSIRAVRVCCTLGVTESDELADVITAGTSADVENLEAFAVCRAAASLPVAVILGVTNAVGPGGGRDWKSNHASVMRTLFERVCQPHTL